MHIHTYGRETLNYFALDANALSLEMVWLIILTVLISIAFHSLYIFFPFVLVHATLISSSQAHSYSLLRYLLLRCCLLHLGVSEGQVSLISFPAEPYQGFCC